MAAHTHLRLRTARAFFCAAALWAASSIAAVGDVGSVGVYTAPARSFSTASYWIEGVDGVVLIDTQFLPKEALLAVEMAEKATGKKVTTAIVLHPNPDKFNGTAVLQQHGIRVVTSAQVAALIPAVHAIRWGWFGQDFAPDYPRDAARPDVFGEQTRTLTIHGLTLQLHVLGAAASGAHVVVQSGEHVFVGDLINPSNHAWLELGLVSEWLARLAEIRALRPAVVHPGRGPQGGPALIDAQAAYLRWVQGAVRDVLTPGDLGWFTKARLQRKVETAYPNFGFPIFVRDGWAAVWKAEQGAR